MFEMPGFNAFSGNGASNPSEGGNVGREGIRRGRMRSQDCGGCQRQRVHCFQRVVLQVGGEDWGEKTEGWSFL